MSDPPAGILPDHLDRSLIGRVPARLALVVLAHAEEPGLPTALWRSGIDALAGPPGTVTDEQLLEFARIPSIEGTVIESGAGTHRLTRPAIAEILPTAPAAREIQRRLTLAWLAHGRDLGWQNAPSYLLRHLPRHALAAGLADALLDDDGYLAHADLERLMPVARQAGTQAGRLRACLLDLTPGAAGVTGAARTAMFSVTDTLEGLGTGAAPYPAVWARTGGRAESDELTGHTDDVNAICQLLVGGEPALATAGRDRTVRLWDPVTERLDRVLTGHSDRVLALCAVPCDGRELLASGGADRTVRLWDPLSGKARILSGHTDDVTALCRVGDLLASGSTDTTVRLWNPATGLTVRTLTGHDSRITALCVIPLDGRPLLASASWDGTVRLWNPATGRCERVLAVHGEYGMCPVEVGDRTLLATAGNDRTVRLTDPSADTKVLAKDVVVDAMCPAGRSLAIAENVAPYRNQVRLWDPTARRPPQKVDGGEQVATMREVSFRDRTRLALTFATGDAAQFVPGDGTVYLTGGDAPKPVSHTDPITALAAVRLTDGTTMLASAASDHTARLWEPTTGRPVWNTRAHVTEVRGMCAVPGALLATAGDVTVRLWHTDTGEEAKVLRGHPAAVVTACPVGDHLLASGAYDRSIRLWDLRTGRTVRELEHVGSVYALTTAEADGRTTLISAGAEGTLVQWNPDTGVRHWQADGHTGWVNDLCLISGLLASAGSDGTVRLWDVRTGKPEGVLTGHDGAVGGVCPVNVNGETLLASAGSDGTVRLWDLAIGHERTVIPVQAPATSCVEADGTLIIGLDTGLLAIRLNG